MHRSRTNNGLIVTLVSGLLFWKDLPDEIRLATTVYHFKSLLKAHFSRKSYHVMDIP